jgi:hypothetical protein
MVTSKQSDNKIKCSFYNLILPRSETGGFLCSFFSVLYSYCFICRPSDSTVPGDARDRTMVTSLASVSTPK